MLFILMFVFFFKDTATTDIYTYWHTLSLHDALPISCGGLRRPRRLAVPRRRAWPGGEGPVRGERATGRGGGEVPARLAGSGPSRWRRERSEEHTSELQSLMRISYAVFCLKKKRTYNTTTQIT